VQDVDPEEDYLSNSTPRAQLHNAIREQRNKYGSTIYLQG
jgi:hypothetical protein